MGHQIVCALALVALFLGTPSGARTRARGASAQGAASRQGGVLAWGAVVLQSARADQGRHGGDRGGSSRDRSSCHGCTAGKAHSRLRGGPFGDAGAAERAIEGRYLRWNWEDDGSLRLEARLPADDGAIVLNGLRAAEEQRPEDMMSTEPMLASPAGAARADALVALARSAVDGSRSGRAGAGGCELVVHVDAGTLASDEVAERCHVEDGPAVAPETARRLGCDAGVVRIVERDGRPLTVGRRTRTIRRRCGGLCAVGTRGVGSQGVRTSGSCMRITSGTGRRAGRRRSRTSFSCAPTTIGWYTRAGSEWSRRAEAQCGFGGLTGGWWRLRPSAGGRAGRRLGSSIGRGALRWIRTRAGRCRRAIGLTTGWPWRC